MFMMREYSFYVIGNLFKEAVIGSLKRLAFIEQVKFKERYKVGPNSHADLYFPDGLEAMGFRPNTTIKCHFDFKGISLDAFRNHEEDEGGTSVVLFVLRDDVNNRDEALDEAHNVKIADRNDYIKLILAFPELWEPLKGVDERYSRIPRYINEAFAIRLAHPYPAENSDDRLKKLIADARASSGKKKVSIILGNGVSIPFGSTTWGNMIDSLSEHLSPDYIDNVDLVRDDIGNNSYSSALLAKNILERKDKYLEAIHASVYGKYRNDLHKPDTIVHAISEIIRRYYGFVEVGTFNYDSFVENDFGLPGHGHAIQPIYELGQRLSKKDFPLFHLHGYLPMSLPKDEDERQKYQDNIVLTQKDYFERYSDKSSFTYSKQRDLYENDICLFVGSSMTDIFQLQCMSEVEGREYFAILRRNKDMTDKDYRELIYYYNSNNITPISVDEFNDISGLLRRLFGV